MASEFREDLNRKLEDPAFAKGFGEEAAKTDLALTLSEARLRRGFTQAELADMLGCSQAYVAKLERGDANPTVGAVGRIMATLGQRLSTGSAPLVSRAHPIAHTHQVRSADTAAVSLDAYIHHTARNVQAVDQSEVISLWQASGTSGQCSALVA